MTKGFAIGSAMACLLMGASPALADGSAPSDTYHVRDLHCAVGGAAACARPSSPAPAQAVSLPATPSETAGDIPPGTNGTSTLAN